MAAPEARNSFLVPYDSEAAREFGEGVWYVPDGPAVVHVGGGATPVDDPAVHRWFVQGAVRYVRGDLDPGRGGALAALLAIGFGARAVWKGLSLHLRAFTRRVRGRSDEARRTRARADAWLAVLGAAGDAPPSPSGPERGMTGAWAGARRDLAAAPASVRWTAIAGAVRRRRRLERRLRALAPRYVAGAGPDEVRGASLAFGLVHYEAPDFLRVALSAVATHHRDAPVTVLDNGSSAAALAEAKTALAVCPGATLLRGHGDKPRHTVALQTLFDRALDADVQTAVFLDQDAMLLRGVDDLAPLLDEALLVGARDAVKDFSESAVRDVRLYRGVVPPERVRTLALTDTNMPM